MSPFEIKDCALLRQMSGLPPAVNLRELRERIAACSPDVLYHHFCDTQLAPIYRLPRLQERFRDLGTEEAWRPDRGRKTRDD